MPLPIIAEGIVHGLSAIPYARTILKLAPWLVGVYLIKTYFAGAKNRSERVMYSKVVLITGGTAGIGAAVTRALAQRGAQIVLLTHHPPSDPFLVEYVDDLRSQTSNELVYAEQVDLASLHSIRQFATRWVDNAPPRRLDMVILCANTLRTPFSKKIDYTRDGLEASWAVNFLANYQLLSILSPALRAQPPDRDVRVIIPACPSYIGAKMISSDESQRGSPLSSSGIYAASKLALIVFAQSFRKHLDAYVRPDKQPNKARVIVVDPGWTRTPGMRRWLSAGSLWGLLLYIVCWPIWWLLLKSPDQGAQSFLHAAMEADFAGQGSSGHNMLVKECRQVNYARKDIFDEKLAQELWEATEKRIEALERESAIKRALSKKEAERLPPDVPVDVDHEKEKNTTGSRRGRPAK